MSPNIFLQDFLKKRKTPFVPNVLQYYFSSVHLKLFGLSWEWLNVKHSDKTFPPSWESEEASGRLHLTLADDNLTKHDTDKKVHELQPVSPSHYITSNAKWFWRLAYLFVRAGLHFCMGLKSTIDQLHCNKYLFNP